MESLAPLTASSTTETHAPSALDAFLEKADFNRFGWSATAALVQGCLLTPTLLLLISSTGAPDWHFLVAFLSFLGVLIPILSALPVRYVFGGFAISFLIHVVLIAYNLL
ncbi:hypothetical protein ACAW74_23850 [Fibrella sp. WM1]|uniref:hypothetical protein n=1 Tax=Fibrella musci TaxID=3242485 RepID=UPI0035224632